MDIVTVGIDLAKNVFALHGVDQSGKAVFIKPKVARSQLLEMVAHLPPCLITLRGQKKVDTQWKLYCLLHNIEKLAHHGYGQ